MNKTIKINKNGFVDIKNFEHIIDISKVKFYSLVPSNDGTLSIKFYNSKKKLVKPYGKLYQKVMDLKNKPLFESNTEAYNHYCDKARKLAEKHGLTAYEFFMEAENTSKLTKDHREIMSLWRKLRMLNYLLLKENKNG